MNREEIARKLSAEGFGEIYEWRDPPGTSYGWHTHPCDEVRYVVSGSITIGTESGERRLGPGDRLDVPAGTRHWAESPEGAAYFCGTKYGGTKY